MASITTTVKSQAYCWKEYNMRMPYCLNIECLVLWALSSVFLSFDCLTLLSFSFVFLFFHSASSSHLPLNLFSLFCKLGVLVRHRISLFGKDSVNIRVNSLKIKYLIFKPTFLKDGKLQLCLLACCLFPCFWWHVVVYPGMLPTHLDFLNSGNICKSLFSLCSLVKN